MSPIQSLPLRRFASGFSNGTTAPQVDDSEYMVSRIETISSGTIDYSRVGFIEKKDAIERFRLKKNDIILSHINSLKMVGNHALYNGKKDLYHGMNLIRITPRNSVNPIYLSYCLKALKNNGYFASIAKPAINQASIPTNSLKSLPVWNIDKIEQDKIADFLDKKVAKIDDAIAKKKNHLDLLEEKQKSIITKLITKGLEQSARLTDSNVPWIGQINTGFKVEKLKYHVLYQEGPGIMAEDFHEGGVPLIRISGLQHEYVECNGKNFLDPKKVQSKWKQFRLEPGDILISASASTGIISEVKDGTEAIGAIAYTGIIRLKVKNDHVLNKDFLKYFINSRIYTEQVSLSVTGTAMQHYGPTHMGRFLIVLPPKPQQDGIVQYLDKETALINKASEKIKKSIELLEEYKISLISNAVTGKVKI